MVFDVTLNFNYREPLQRAPKYMNVEGLCVLKVITLGKLQKNKEIFFFLSGRPLPPPPPLSGRATIERIFFLSLRLPLHALSAIKIISGHSSFSLS